MLAYCLSALFVVPLAHGMLLVMYGPGTREDERVMVMNSKGGTTTEDARISYVQCPVGSKQRALDEQQSEDGRDTNEQYECGMELLSLFLVSEMESYSNPWTFGVFRIMSSRSLLQRAEQSDLYTMR